MNSNTCTMTINEAAATYESKRQELIEKNEKMHTSDSYYGELKKIAECAKKILAK